MSRVLISIVGGGGRGGGSKRGGGPRGDPECKIVLGGCPDCINDDTVRAQYKSFGDDSINDIFWLTSKEDGSFRGVGQCGFF